MHVLVDTRHLNKPRQSGVGEYTINILRALFDLDDNTRYTLFSSGTTFSDKHYKRLSNEGIGEPKRIGRRSVQRIKKNVHRVHLHTPNKALNARMFITGQPTLNQLSVTNPDVIFFPNLNITPTPTQTPYVLTVHDLAWHMFPEFYSKKMQIWHRATKANSLISGAASCICPSNSTKRDLQREFKITTEQIAVIPHGINPKFQPKRRPTDHGVRSKYHLPKKFALFLGTIEPRKNVEAVIKGVQTYRKNTNDDLELVLVGGFGWKHRRIKQMIKDTHHDWIKHLGHVPAKDCPAIYREADIFLWPSIYEGFGLPVLESMACGTPVITSRTSSLPEITRDAAILIDPHNINDVTVSLEQYFSDKDLREHLSQKSLERANKFSWKKAAILTKKQLENIK